MTHNQLVNKWKSIRGDKTLRLDYDLNENSIVIDGGGYKGEWSNNISNKYDCIIHIFEPVTEYYNLITERFKNNDKIHVHKYGLSNTNKTVDIYLSNDGSSVHIANGPKETINMVDINDYFSKLNITKIDLMKLNVEGEEYNILERVIETNMLKMFTDLQIQFHRFGENYETRKNKIEFEIKKLFTPTYEYPYVWVNYNIKF